MLKNYYRYFYLCLFIACILSISTGFFIEYQFFYPPCPLCILQRFCYGFIGFISLIAFIHNPKVKTFGKYFYPYSVIFFSIIGILFASRQIWLQHLPKDQMPACLGGLLDLISNYSFLGAIHTILLGKTECGDNSFLIFGLGIATWSLMLFSMILISNIVVLYFIYKKK